MSRLYHAERRTDGTATVTVGGRPLDPRVDLRDHAPFDWGRPGPGAYQLGLALLADAFADEARALRLHERFALAFVAELPWHGWSLTPGMIADGVLAMTGAHAVRTYGRSPDGAHAPPQPLAGEPTWGLRSLGGRDSRKG